MISTSTKKPKEATTPPLKRLSCKGGGRSASKCLPFMAPTRQRKASTTQLNLGPGPENTNRKSPPGLSHLTNSSRWSWSPSPWVLHSQAGLSNTTSCRYGLSFCPVIRCSLGMTNKGRLLLYSYLQLPSKPKAPVSDPCRKFQFFERSCRSY